MNKSYKITIARHIVQLLFVWIFLSAVISKNIILSIALVLTILLGPIFCGWVCTFGLFQDGLRYVGSFIRKEPFEFDYKYHKIFSWLRYVILVGLVTVGSIFVFPNEIKHNFIDILSGRLSINLAFFGLVIFAVLSLFTKRFFCRYVCPMGAKRGLFSLLRPLTVKRDSKGCIGCKACSRACLMHIEVDKANDLANPNCIDCFRCIESCPKNCLSLGLRNFFKP